MNVAMLLSNAFRPDPRVLKEATSLAEAGNNITVICWDRLGEFQPQQTIFSKLNIYRVQSIRSSYGIGIGQLLPLLRFWRAAIRVLDTLRPDIIHCHDFDTIPAGLFWGKIHHIPVIYDAHEYYADLVRPRLKGLVGSLLHTIIRTSDKYAARLSSAVVTVDEKLAGNYSRLNRDVLVIGHYPNIQFAQEANQVFTHSDLTLLYAGRISTDRGALLYIDLLRQLRFLGIPARLIFAGIYTPANEEHIVHQHLNGMEFYFNFIGWVAYQQMVDIYRSADVGLSILLPEPRYVAALPVKLFEYMACGLPVVVSNFHSIASIIDETNCGVCVNPLSPVDEIAHIIQGWWGNPIVPRALGENGRKAIFTKYNWENQIKGLLLLYDNLLAN